ncbi:Copalyl diphosphate synthase [Madurella mycetomatis]|uniref:Copalyl diphosphate synthase n=1 Tax=Madurella mycetomatis TaxID=100816 RepID=A0A175VS10_9PEZI|nr:Copalyl diphosphate synthase [Madurella mycetomatis]
MDSSMTLHGQAQALLAGLASQCSKGFGSMSASVYDTAWLSMVHKTGEWLFPECFDFILEQQLPSGAWEPYATPLDGILNTAAALLTLKKHLKKLDPEQHDDHRQRDWLLRSHGAEAALKAMLHDWDVDSTDQVGFEILVVSLLTLLQKEGGVSIDFPGLDALRAVRDAKLAKLPPSTLYQMPSTLYHALEAFIGHIDFDRVRPWRDADGSMMASPASTAAYLMNSSTWDDEAEAYLRRVLDRQTFGGADRRSVPCAWPTTIFETSWVVTTLVSAGVVIGEAEASTLGNLLRGALLAQKGLLGFAPGTLPDVDDTAKGLESLHYLSQGDNVSVDGLVRKFEANEHFMTYPGERNPSFSANCNVLILFLVRDDRAQHVALIVKAVRFLTRSVFGGHVNEKWHLSELYWVVLLARAFQLLLQHREVALAVSDLDPALREEIPMVSLSIMMHILRAQQANGSWDGGCEITSYAILALSSLEKLPWVRQLDTGRIFAAMALGKSFLHTNRSEWTKGRHVWIEKVTYASSVLSEAYCLAAALVPLPSTIQPQQEGNSRAAASADTRLLLGMRKAGNLIARTPLFSNTDRWALRVAEMQACFAMQALQRQPVDVFPRTTRSKDKYLFIIPLALTASALEPQRSGEVSLSVLYEMMTLSVLNFHADEYMESIVEGSFAGNLNTIRDIVRQLFTEIQQPNGSKETDGTASNEHHREDTEPTLTDIKAVISRFVRRILHHPAVLSSPASLQKRLAFELQTFLLAHITQAEDNHRLRSQWGQDVLNEDSNEIWSGATASSASAPSPNSPAARLRYREPGRTFYHWVRSTSADHTSCPFSFVFFNCLVHAASLSSSSTKKNNYDEEEKTALKMSARTAYLAEDACRHLASLCRMYNDAGSAVRDDDERALNSLNFPEFFLRSTSDCGRSRCHHRRRRAHGESAAQTMTEELLWIAEYERRGLETAMELLEDEIGTGCEWVRALRLFVGVTDLYGQIYVLQDVGMRTR